MCRFFRPGLAGLVVLCALLLPSCTLGSNRSSSTAANGEQATPLVLQLPSAYTKTSTSTVTSKPQPKVTPTPSLLSSSSPVVSAPIAAGYNHTCAIDSAGGVMCWGSNEYGQLGDGSQTNRNHPVEVKGLSGRAVAVTAGWGHTCALTADGAVECWGLNKNGELGDGTVTTSNHPVEVKGLSTGVIAIASGDDHTCAITTDDGLICWGINTSGELGNGSTASSTLPVGVTRLTGGTVAVAAGSDHTCVLTVRGEVMCWGNNDLGQLGDGVGKGDRGNPDVVPDLEEEVSALAARNGTTCILTQTGAVQCWGYNKYGQLGDGTAEDQPSPVDVTGQGGLVYKIAVGWEQTCAVLEDQTMECWGWNFYGQLGDGTNTSKLTPVAVKGLNGKVMEISAGGRHTCALMDTGDIYCWGFNENGQLGDYTNLDSNLPVKVVDFTGSVAG